MHSVQSFQGNSELGISDETFMRKATREGDFAVLTYPVYVKFTLPCATNSIDKLLVLSIYGTVNCVQDSRMQDSHMQDSRLQDRWRPDRCCRV
jgi:hypothetical protein